MTPRLDTGGLLRFIDKKVDHQTGNVDTGSFLSASKITGKVDFGDERLAFVIN